MSTTANTPVEQHLFDNGASQPSASKSVVVTEPMFTLFPLLAPEIRLDIWAYTCAQPRYVDVAGRTRIRGERPRPFLEWAQCDKHVDNDLARDDDENSVSRKAKLNKGTEHEDSVRDEASNEDHKEPQDEDKPSSPLRPHPDKPYPYYYHSYTPIPAVLHASRESRTEGLKWYHPAFSTIFKGEGFDLSTYFVQVIS